MTAFQKIDSFIRDNRVSNGFGGMIIQRDQLLKKTRQAVTTTFANDTFGTKHGLSKITQRDVSNAISNAVIGTVMVVALSIFGAAAKHGAVKAVAGVAAAGVGLFTVGHAGYVAFRAIAAKPGAQPDPVSGPVIEGQE
jgi:hypothetical protein